jgi:hypothetical protein
MGGSEVHRVGKEDMKAAVRLIPGYFLKTVRGSPA